MALINHMLNNANQEPAFMLNPNIDPQLQMQLVPQILSTPQNTQTNLAGIWLIFLLLKYMTNLFFSALHIFARISINNKITHDIEFEAEHLVSSLSWNTLSEKSIHASFWFSTCLQDFLCPKTELFLTKSFNSNNYKKKDKQKQDNRFYIQW